MSNKGTPELVSHLDCEFRLLVIFICWAWWRHGEEENRSRNWGRLEGWQGLAWDGDLLPQDNPLQLRSPLAFPDGSPLPV